MTSPQDHLSIAVGELQPSLEALLMVADEPLDALTLASAVGHPVDLVVEARTRWEQDDLPVVVSGCIGPRGDGYQPDSLMTAEEAQAYHAVQIGTFADTEADLVTALTMTYADEAVGITCWCGPT